MTSTFDVIVPPDDFGVIVDEEALQIANYFTTDNLVDENGNTLVDENGAELVVIATHTGNVYVVAVAPDDFGVIVEEDGL